MEINSTHLLVMSQLQSQLLSDNKALEPIHTDNCVCYWDSDIKFRMKFAIVECE